MRSLADRLGALPCTLVGWGRLAIIVAVVGALIWRLAEVILGT